MAASVFAAAVLTAGVFTAGVTALFAVVVMVVAAAEILTEFERVVQKRLCHLTDIAFSSADHEDKSKSESVDGTAADAAANEDINLFLCQQSCEGTVSGAAGRDDFFAGNLAVSRFKNGKFGRVSEVLEDLMVFTSDCDFHFFSCSELNELNKIRKSS